MPEYADLQTFFIVLMAIVGFILTIDKVLDIAKRRLNDPKHHEMEWKESVDERLEQGDEHFKKLDSSFSILIESQLQILNHMAYGNHTDELKESINKIQSYLIEVKSNE